MYWRLAFISLACLIYLTDACLRAETKPVYDDPAVNWRFSIKCRFYPCRGDNIIKVISLKLVRTSGSRSQKIGQISNNWSNRLFHYFPFFNKVVYRPNQGHSFLSAQWTVPYVQSPSFYQCVAVGRDRAGRLRTFKKLAFLGGAGRFPFGRYKPYRTRLRQCLAREKALSNERTQYLTQFVAVRDELRKINEARGNLFHGALHYGGHRYYASKFQFETVETAQAICQSTGGYLVELDNAGEYYAFRNYIIGLHLRAESVLLGGTDQARVGTWVFQHSGRYIPYFDWVPGEPSNGGIQRCMSLWLSRGARMDNIHCWRVGSVVHFACEVPSSADL